MSAALKDEDIARIAHEACRAYCHLIGDTNPVPWDQSPSWRRREMANEVRRLRNMPAYTRAAIHEEWRARKIEEGWAYGPVRGEWSKLHPRCVPYPELPKEERIKDALFESIVSALLGRS